VTDHIDKPGLRLLPDSTRVSLPATEVSKLTLGRVLDYLSINDQLFEHNVPSEWQDRNRAGLLRYLAQTYSKEKFVVSDPKLVEENLKRFDYVLFNGQCDHFEYNFCVEAGMKGVIQKINLDKKRPFNVLWEKSTLIPKTQSLQHIGTNLHLYGKFSGEKIVGEENILKHASVGMTVEANAIMKEYLMCVPIGTQGIVREIRKSTVNQVSVIFGRSKGYIMQDDYSAELTCKYSVLSLVRENNIDIGEIVREVS
jgi:hypothetical protein